MRDEKEFCVLYDQQLDVAIYESKEDTEKKYRALVILDMMSFSTMEQLGIELPVVFKIGKNIYQGQYTTIVPMFASKNPENLSFKDWCDKHLKKLN